MITIPAYISNSTITSFMLNHKSELGRLLRERRGLAFPIISISEVAQRIGESDFFTFDCTSHNSYLMHRIPGAKYIGLIYCISELPPNKESSLVFYAKNSQCKTATNAAKKAREAGYSNTFIMRAGISGWLLLNKPTLGRRGIGQIALESP